MAVMFPLALFLVLVQLLNSQGQNLHIKIKWQNSPNHIHLTFHVTIFHMNYVPLYSSKAELTHKIFNVQLSISGNTKPK